MANHVATQCDYCGVQDDHPKSHWNSGETYHHDCLPFDKKAELIESHPHAKSIVEAAESGTRGEALREHILNLHAENVEVN